MPRPPHLCQCGKIVAHGTRCTCQIASTRARNKRHDANRPNARARGYNRQWEAARAEFLAVHAHCAHPTCTSLATVVDHITAHRGDRNLFWSKSNWQPLCAHHHNSSKQRQERNT